MYEVRATHDEETGKPLIIHRLWVGDTQDAFEVFDTEHPSDRITGPWTYATAREIAISMNRDDELERSATDGHPSTDQ